MRDQAISLRKERKLGVEGLEGRLLLSVVKVASFGATGNGVTDDTLAIQQAINTSTIGDTIDFGVGRYNISKTLTLKSNRNYTGAATLDWTASGGGGISTTESDAQNINISGLTFDGGGKTNGITYDSSGTPAVNNVNVTGCTFLNSGTTWKENTGLYLSNHVTNSLISGNTFKNIQDNCLIGFDMQNVTVSNNTFDSVGEGMHFIFSGTQIGTNVTVSGNVGTNLTRMGVEIQGDNRNSSGIVVENNQFSNWSAAAASGSPYGLSIVSDAQGTIVRDNVLTDHGSAHWGVELGGYGTIAENNVIDGFRNAFAIGGGQGSIIRNNLLMNQSDRAINKYNAGVHPGMTIDGNVIVNPQNSGIGATNSSFWSGTTIKNNIILRAGGAWANDASTDFEGIPVDDVGAGNAPLTITGNTIMQTAANPVSGFTFRGLPLFGSNGSLAGTVISNNTVASVATTPMGSGVYGNASGALTGVSFTNNTFQNLAKVTEGSGGSFSASGNQAINGVAGSAAAGFVATWTNRTLPAAQFSATQGGANAVNFDASASTSAASYRWSYGDGAMGTGVTASHGYGQSGAYPVMLLIQDSGGAVAVSLQNVQATATQVVTTPTAPTNLGATAASSSQINLSWVDTATNATGYTVQRSTDGVTFATIGTLGATATGYSDTGLAASTTYSYRVSATNSAGASSYTSVASATTASQVAAPTAPTGMAATAASSSKINLSWTNTASNATGTKIERSTDGVNFVQVGMVSGTTSSYSDASLTSGTKYYYRVRATNSAGDSGYSGVASAVTQTATGTIRINLGGSTVGAFIGDKYVSGGRNSHTTSTINTSAVTNPAPQSVYQTARVGTFTYTIPNFTPGASYQVRLDFAEIYWSAAGKRAFNVAINGNKVLNNFDIFAAAGGKNVAIARTFTATASASGTITISFTTVKDNAMCNGIEITPA